MVFFDNFPDKLRLEVAGSLWKMEECADKSPVYVARSKEVGSHWKMECADKAPVYVAHNKEVGSRWKMECADKSPVSVSHCKEPTYEVKSSTMAPVKTTEGPAPVAYFLDNPQGRGTTPESTLTYLESQVLTKASLRCRWPGLSKSVFWGFSQIQ